MKKQPAPEENCPQVLTISKRITEKEVRALRADWETAHVGLPPLARCERGWKAVLLFSVGIFGLVAWVILVMK